MIALDPKSFDFVDSYVKRYKKNMHSIIIHYVAHAHAHTCTHTPILCLINIYHNQMKSRLQKKRKLL
jgi:hypothetical protein